MTTGKVTSLNRKDIRPQYNNIPIEEIAPLHFKKECIEDIASSEVVIFNDNDMRAKVLKNRSGNRGIVN